MLCLVNNQKLKFFSAKIATLISKTLTTKLKKSIHFLRAFQILPVLMRKHELPFLFYKKTAAILNIQNNSRKMGGVTFRY